MVVEIYGVLSYPRGNFVPNSKHSETLKNKHHIFLDKVLQPKFMD